MSDNSIDTGGGAIIYGNVDTGGGDFVGRDQYLIIQLPDGSRRRIPYQLPAPPEAFTGREKAVAAVGAALEPGRQVTICGPGGMGKTAVAAAALWTLHEAGDLQQRFPGGVVRHDFYTRPATADAFRTIVAAYLDEDAGAIPEEKLAGVAERLLATHRPLLFLDGAENAADLHAVRQISGGCTLLQTSRRREDGHGGRRLDLSPLPEKEAIRLLQTLAGALAPEAPARAIVDLVGRLPLALQLAGSYMEATGEPAAAYLAALRQSPLGELHRGEHRQQSVAILLQKSVAQVEPAARAILALAGRLALAPIPAAPLAHALGGGPEREGRADDTEAKARRVPANLDPDTSPIRRPLAALVNFSLLLRDGNFYQPAHALIHTYARRRLDADPATLARLAGYYDTLVRAARQRGPEGYPTLAAARPHAIALLPHLRAAARWDALLSLAWALGDYLDVRGYTADRFTLARAAIDAARAAGNRYQESAWLNTLGNAYADVSRVEEAIAAYEQALVISREIGDRRGEGNRLDNLGLAYAALGRLEEAVAHHEQALAIAREIGDRRGESNRLGNLGLAYSRLGRVEEAITHHEQALALSRALGDRRHEGADLGNLGIAYQRLGRVEEAIAAYEQALAIARALGDRRNEGAWLGNLGIAYQHLGRLEEAVAHHAQALAVSRALGDRGAEGNHRFNLAIAYQRQGQRQTAIAHMEQALAAYQAVDATAGAADARAWLAAHRP